MPTIDRPKTDSRRIDFLLGWYAVLRALSGLVVAGTTIVMVVGCSPPGQLLATDAAITLQFQS
jgi:hypothetical protein